MRGARAGRRHVGTGVVRARRGACVRYVRGRPRRARLRRQKTAIALAALMAVAALDARPTAGQEPGTVVGVVAGGARTTQLWQPEESTEAIYGLLLGGFADVPTPAAWLGVRVEGAYVRRGGDVELVSGGQPAPGRIRVDYLSVAVHLKVHGALGPIHAHLSAGPTLDQPLRSRLDPLLAQALAEESPVIFAVAVGGGAGVRVTEGLFVSVEARLTEGVSDAHAGGFTTVRDRSIEGMLRVGVPLSLLRSR